MKKLLMIIMILPFMGFAQEDEEQILSMTQFHIKQGHSAQFEDGVKKYNECYGNDNGKETWNFWKRVQGEGSVYGVSSFMEKWAEMDADDPAGKDCYNIVVNYIMPHVESTRYDLAMTMPDWSRKTARESTPKLLWATYYDVKKDGKFSEIVSEVIATMKEKEGDSRAYWYDIMGGDKDGANYMVTTLYGSYAELDMDKDSPYEMYVKAKGEKKAKALSEEWNKAVNNSWSYIWEFKSELSN
jgi:hypothetical protein